MSALLFLPFVFLKFWFLEAPRELIHYFISLNNAFLQQFSLPLLLRTFFKPLKNEYREGLIWFSIGMGVFVKFWIILIDLLLLFILIGFEILFLAAFLIWPAANIYLLLF